MNQSDEQARRYPKNIEDTTWYRGLTKQEVGLIAIPLFVGLILLAFLPGSLAFIGVIIVVGGMLVGGVLIIRTPDYLEPIELLEGYIAQVFNPGKVKHVRYEKGMGRKSNSVGAKVYELKETTQQVQQIKKLHPYMNTAELKDGTLVGGIRVYSPNMVMVDSETWRSYIDRWISYLDNTVEYEIKIHARSVPFDAEDHLKRYEKRLDSPDIKDRPILEELIESYLTWYPEYLSYQGLYNKEYYMMVYVDPDENLVGFESEESFRDILSGMPLIGSLVSDSDDDLTDEERRALMFKELQQRVREAGVGGIGKLPGAEYKTLSTTEIAILTKEFWDGSKSDLDMSDEDIAQMGISVRSDDNPVSPTELKQENAPN